MDAVKLYLAKFKGLRPADDQLKESLQSVVKELLGIELAKKNITVQRWTVFVSGSAGLKSEIYINREKILTALSTKLSRPGPRQLLWKWSWRWFCCGHYHKR